jgi:4-aminobutyrate--pyruvate transaminase
MTRFFSRSRPTCSAQEMWDMLDHAVTPALSSGGLCYTGALRPTEEARVAAIPSSLSGRGAAGLRPLLDHPMIGDLEGCGPLIAMEIVRDKRARKGFPPEAKVNAVLMRHCDAHGLIARLGNDRAAFTPPLIMTEAEADEAVKRLRRALDHTWKDVCGA